MLLLSSASALTLSKENEFESFLSEVIGASDDKTSDSLLEVPTDSKKATKLSKKLSEPDIDNGIDISSLTQSLRSKPKPDEEKSSEKPEEKPSKSD